MFDSLLCNRLYAGPLGKSSVISTCCTISLSATEIRLGPRRTTLPYCLCHAFNCAYLLKKGVKSANNHLQTRLSGYLRSAWWIIHLW